jgi:uncharacterized protein YutE (UPF0331/DUF86 family)|tara:strand:+ start:376 stop:591 length:216 start_codon:yes stop_codon:yes gene_type:complete
MDLETYTEKTEAEKLLANSYDSLGDYAQKLIDKNFERRKACINLVGELISEYDDLNNREIKRKLLNLMHAI